MMLRIDVKQERCFPNLPLDQKKRSGDHPNPAIRPLKLNLKKKQNNLTALYHDKNKPECNYDKNTYCSLTRLLLNLGLECKTSSQDPSEYPSCLICFIKNT